MRDSPINEIEEIQIYISLHLVLLHPIPLSLTLPSHNTLSIPFPTHFLSCLLLFSSNLPLSIVTHLISFYSFSFPRIIPDNFIPLILKNFHQLQRTRYTCDLLDQLCLFVSTYYHLHLSFPHQYPTRETSLKTTKQQPKIMNCVPKYDSF